jgi:hypothetical protein
MGKSQENFRFDINTKPLVKVTTQVTGALTSIKYVTEAKLSLIDPI